MRMKSISYFLHPLLAVTLLSSCLRMNMQEDGAVLTAKDLIVPADVETGVVTASLAVSSNQSWSASLQEDCDWVEFSTMEHLNPSMVSDEGIIEMTFEDNPDYSPRSFKLDISGPGIKHTVTVTQQAKSNRLRVGSGTRLELEAEPLPQQLSILSNTRWTVSADPSEAIVDVAEGYGNATLSVSLQPNYAIHESKTVKLVVKGDGLEAVEVEYILAGNEPFVRFDAAQAVEFLPIDKAGLLKFFTNGSWTATVKESSIASLSLSAASGEAGEISLPFSFEMNPTREKRSAVIEIALDGWTGVKYPVTITQYGGLALFVDFSSSQPLRPAYASVPEISSTPISGGQVSNTYLFTQDGKDYEFVIRNEAYSYGKGDALYNGYLLLSIGSIAFPAVEDMRLTNVMLLHAATNKKMSITKDSYGKTPVPGGTALTVGKYATPMWTLTDTEMDWRYYLYLSTSSARIVNMTLLYE